MEKILATSIAPITQVKIGNDYYFKISNSDSLRPFFMSVVSDSNHWMFISSNGGLSAGRKDSENALFPYYTDDKITESVETTGSKTIFRVDTDNVSKIWEPFSDRYEGMCEIQRNLYKSIYGNKILFEEINHDLNLTYRYHWSSSNLFGFVRTSSLTNNSKETVSVEFVDGIQNIVPYGVGSAIQNQSSNLVDAYKRSELVKDSGLGIYALSAIIVDKAEPSEALKANVVWSIGLDNPKYLLSSRQLKKFRSKRNIEEELDVKAEKGAYFLSTRLELEPDAKKQWKIIADVNKDHSTIVELSELIKHEEKLSQKVEANIDLGTTKLIELNATADAFQLTADSFRDSRHFSNVLFNIMRGGIFDNNYQIEKWDFTNYLANANREVFESSKEWINQLPDVFSLSHLKDLANKTSSSNLKRLCLEYMPLKFSRRHGDPSRPWNKFLINTRSEVDGSKILDYEGNWRDIFQNWEALALSYPEFVESMIHKFLNASTFDGYNPYRITKGGIDWETIEPDDPWSYIGYWGDHQIIYLLKLLEIIENHYPGKLETYFEQEIFVYANVPYKIKPYADILKNPKDTIEFDEEADHKIQAQKSSQGADGALLRDGKGEIYTVNLIEKILATTLAKISNFIPEGGIWMNTQRPEWNDANNALVGNGVSMVTLYYLRRFLKFFEGIMESCNIESVQVSNEVVDFYKRVREELVIHQDSIEKPINDSFRKSLLDEIGKAASDFRGQVYEHSFWGRKRTISTDGIRRFIKVSLKYLEHSIDSNKRTDNLYHAYNLMTVENDKEVSISYLSEMLEGQVAVLSSGYLSSKQALDVLDSLKSSALFREDQYSYLLYPNKDLPKFIEKNTIPREHVDASELLVHLVNDGNIQIVSKDILGNYHFDGNFKNAADLEFAMENLSKTKYAELVRKEKQNVLEIFEQVFNHKAFTGRSGTFFGYEGLGSIYWHMVSKLQLATQEVCLHAIATNETEEVIGRLLEHYYEINEGIGVHKPPSLYGAFPTDPYSHTPAGKGAQQPGMTGQVKEDILSRFGELGVFVRDGQLCFDPGLLRKDEFLTESKVFNYVDVQGGQQDIRLEPKMLCFTYCQVPVVYIIGDTKGVSVVRKDGNSEQIQSLTIDEKASTEIFKRTGEIVRVEVVIEEQQLR